MSAANRDETPTATTSRPVSLDEAVAAAVAAAPPMTLEQRDQVAVLLSGPNSSRPRRAVSLDQAI